MTQTTWIWCQRPITVEVGKRRGYDLREVAGFPFARTFPQYVDRCHFVSFPALSKILLSNQTLCCTACWHRFLARLESESLNFAHFSRTYKSCNDAGSARAAKALRCSQKNSPLQPHYHKSLSFELEVTKKCIAVQLETFSFASKGV